MINRRAFGFGLAGSLALVALGLPIVLVDEDRFLLAAIDACFPATGDLPSAAEVHAVDKVRAYLDKLPTVVAMQARGLFRFVEASTLPTHGHRFSSLDVAERTAILQDFATSTLYPRRLVAHALKQICAIGYWSSPETWNYLGYDGPLVGRGTSP